MIHKYSVRVFLANPRNNHETECDTLDDAKREMKSYTTDDADGQVAIMFRDGEMIARRDLNKKISSGANEKNNKKMCLRD